jgi:hypothetical protein
MAERAALTWGYVKDWAQANGLSDNAVVRDDYGHPFAAWEYDPEVGRVVLLHDRYLSPMNWGMLKAALNGKPVLPDDRLTGLEVGDVRRIVDISSWEEIPGINTLIFQYRYG